MDLRGYSIQANEGLSPVPKAHQGNSIEKERKPWQGNLRDRGLPTARREQEGPTAESHLASVPLYLPPGDPKPRHQRCLQVHGPQASQVGSGLGCFAMVGGPFMVSFQGWGTSALLPLPRLLVLRALEGR